MTSADNPLVAWTLDIHAIPQSGLAKVRVATATERAAVAKALDILDCKALSVAYGLKQLGGGRYRLKGTVTASVVQACVVTLEPVAGVVEDDIAAEFRPATEISAESGVIDLDAEIDIEPITDDGVDLGRIVYEHLASALDPYPRKGDASFDWREDKPVEKPNPFAVLAKVRDRK